MRIITTFFLFFTCFLSGAIAQSNFRATPIPVTVNGQTRMSACNFGVSLSAIFQPTCYGYTDGTVQFSFTGNVTGGGLLTYTVDNLPPQVGNPVFIGIISGGNHTIIAMSPDGCSDTLAFFMPQPPQILINVVVDSVTCFGGLDGKCVASATGGTLPIGYTWNTPFTTFNSTIANLTAGSYTCTVTDNKGCTNSKTVPVYQPDAISALFKVDSLSCNANKDGKITTSVSGGTPNYTYAWTGPSGFTSSAQNLTNLVAGDYTVTITDNNGCFIVSTLTVAQKPSFTMSLTKTNVACFGGSSGSIVATIKGGAAPFTYQWSAPGSVSSTLSNIPAGFYKLTITDNAGCKANDTISVTQNPQLSVALVAVSPSCNSIKDGTISATVKGGVAPYTYKWTLITQTTANVTGLGSGSYTVTVTDSKDCTATGSTTLTPTSVQTINLVSNNPKCSTSTDGSIAATLNGGVAPITYTWSNNTTNALLSNVGGGSYTVVATDAKGCKTNKTSVLIAPLAIVLDSVVAFEPACSGNKNGKINLYVNGGTGALAFKWNDPNAQFLNPAIGLGAGTYKATVTDANACTLVITKVLNEPLLLALTFTTNDVKCFGGNDGQITSTIVNGKAPFLYSWDDPNAQSTSIATALGASTYNVTVTDASGCKITGTSKINQPSKPLSIVLDQTAKSCANVTQNAATVNADGGTPSFSYKWSNGSSFKNIAQLKKGTYSVTVTDFNGCKAADSLKVEELDSIKANIIVSTPSCFGKKDGQLAVNLATGGIGQGVLSNYIINWNTVPLQIGDVATGLVGNKSYTATVSDQQGCSVFVSTFVAQPQKIKSIFKVVAPKCFAGNDGSIEATLNSANPITNYQWSGNANGQTTPQITNIAGGTYNFVATDSKNCTFDTTLFVNQPDKITFTNFVKNDVICHSQSNGQLSLVASGGTGALSYNWSNGVTNNAISKLVSGTYKLTVTDANACKRLDSFFVAEPSAMNAIIETEDVTCFGDTDGKMSIQASGGTFPYLYSSDGINYNGINNLIGLKAGAYSIYLKDKNNCLATFSTKIATPSKFSFVIQKDTIIQAGQTVDLFITNKNAFGNVSYKWSGSQGITCDTCSRQTITPISSVSYKVYGIDENGCKAEDDVAILLKRNNSVHVPTGFSPNGDAINNVLLIHGKDETTILSFKVFDRWGEQLFDAGPFKLADAASNAWDGNFRATPMPSGIYVWYINVKYSDGSNEMLKGNTTLIR